MSTDDHSTTRSNHHTHSLATAILLLAMLTLTALTLPAKADSQRTIARATLTTDTLPTIRINRFNDSENPDMRSRMMTTAQPVEITQRGRHLCVESGHRQLLPVYTSRGSFYTAFPLQKGMNWLNGLPRGTYIINNRRFTIS